MNWNPFKRIAELEAVSAREYAYHMVNYNDDRIARLQDRLNELKEKT